MHRRLIPTLTLALAAVISAAQQDKGFDLLDVTWKLSFNEQAQTIAGSVVNTVKLSRPTNTVRLHAARMKIASVAVDGKKAKWANPSPFLDITLPKAGKANQTVKLRIDYSTKPEAGVYFTPAERAFPATTSHVYTQGEAEDTRFWLPTWDKPDDKATSKGSITVPVGYFALSNGQLGKVVKTPKNWTYHWRMDQPHVTYLISFVAGQYEMGQEKWDGIPVEWYVPKGLKAMGMSSFAGTNRMVEFFSQLTGFRYPYAKFAQAVVGDFPFGGMENISAVTNTIRTLHLPKEKPLANSDGLNLHELAHQWFGDVVTCKDWSHAWINEGFASFMPNFYVRKFTGEDEYQVGRYDTLMGAIGAMKGEPRQMVLADWDTPMNNFDGHTYGGGAARMYVLMSVVGEESFWKGVKDFLHNYKFQSVTTEDFFNSMSKSTGRDLEWFRKEYFYTPALPEVTVTQNGDTVTLTQGATPFTLDLDVWVAKGGGWDKQVVKLHGKEASFKLGEGGLYLVDPEVEWIMELKYAKPRSGAHLTNLYIHAPGSAQRARLIDEAQANGLTELVGVMSGTPITVLKHRAMQHVPSSNTGALLFMARSDDKVLRSMGYGKMARGAKDAVLPVLLEAWRTEHSDILKRDALNSILTLTKDKSYAEAAWKMDSHEDILRQAAMNWLIGNHPDEGREWALAAVAKGTENVRNDAIRALGRLKDKPGERRVYNALVSILNKPGFIARNAAIGALADYGDPAAISVLEPFTRHGMFQVYQAARGAVERLKAAPAMRGGS